MPTIKTFKMRKPPSITKHHILTSTILQQEDTKGITSHTRALLRHLNIIHSAKQSS
ncbi:hypothetical protein EG68_08468 [Paragonimus skrjabini miyazakii]|uniref:Uncharacterized protein n=1 Tax=Paragonimus skrjabini miyazakii TaxID=59628 RepID=A0A8S9YW70_9TREM|nr:hypothetical protein EG68_08468 [Paragonimus skrjabini miyazakii]